MTHFETRAGPRFPQQPGHLYLLTTTAGERFSLRAVSLGAAIATARGRGQLTGGLQLENLNLSGTDLSGLDLAGSWLLGTRLDGANLAGTDLSGVHACGASFCGANLSGARLAGAQVTCADFGGANLSGADLRRVNLRATGLTGASLDGALLAYTTLGTALTGAQVLAAETAAVQLNLFDRLRVTPGLAGRLEGALRGGFFLGTVRGRLPGHAVTGRDLGPAWESGDQPPTGAARHWLAEVWPHTPASDPRVALVLGLLARWHSEGRMETN